MEMSGRGDGDHGSKKSVTITAPAGKLSAELLRAFVAELVQRASKIADAENAATLDTDSLERVLPQTLLDF